MLSRRAVLIPQLHRLSPVREAGVWVVEHSSDDHGGSSFSMARAEPRRDSLLIGLFLP